MSISEVDLLRHILEESQFLIDNSRGLSELQFMGDEIKQRAFVRSLEIIGEATRKISPETRSKYPEVEWKKMGAMRNRLIHDYFGVDYQIVYEVITTKIKPLVEQINRMIVEIGQSEESK